MTGNTEKTKPWLIKGVPDRIRLAAKALAGLQGRPMGEVVTEAIEDIMRKYEVPFGQKEQGD